MAAASNTPTSGNKSATSRWGSFLQQAVANVESRLDTILAEPGDLPATTTPSDTPATPTIARSNSRASERGVSRSPSKKGQDRLQERLAKAVARNNATKAAGTDPQPDLPSRTASPALSDFKIDDASSRGSLESSRNDAADSTHHQEPAVTNGQETVIGTADEAKEYQPVVKRTSLQLAQNARLSVDSHRSLLASLGGVDMARDESNASVPDTVSIASESVAKSAVGEDVVARLRADYEAAELRRQEELHTFTEKIDALEAKLHYLSRESSEAARKAAKGAPAGSLERKIAEKDEQIALLMEEGQKLSKQEMKYLTALKATRQKLIEQERISADAKKKHERLEKMLAEAKLKANRALDVEKRVNDKLKILNQAEKELELLRTDRDKQTSLIADLQSQLDDVKSQANEADKKAQSDALETQKKLVMELRDELSSLKIEKELSEERSKSTIKDLEEKLEREREKARVVEIELKGEQTMLESKLEAIRAQAEEVTLGATGNAQTKLLRQIETLQTQYSIATENWQGIETSLLSRITNLEKERDDVSRREGENRKKMKEANSRARRLEEDTEYTSSKMQSLESNLADLKAELEPLRRRAELAEADIIRTHEEHDKNRQAWEHEMLERVELERRRVLEEIKMEQEMLEAQMPVAIAESPSQQSSPTPQLYTEPEAFNEITSSPTTAVSSWWPSIIRRPSAQQSDLALSNLQGSTSSLVDLPRQSMSTEALDSPLPTSALAGINMTPSSNLIGTLTSLIKTLENQSKAQKQELASLRKAAEERTTQSLEEKIDALKGELERMQEREEIALEMLGEKSELVEEQKADIEDLKHMYRELVESTVGK